MLLLLVMMMKKKREEGGGEEVRPGLQALMKVLTNFGKPCSPLWPRRGCLPAMEEASLSRCARTGQFQSIPCEVSHVSAHMLTLPYTRGSA